MERLEVPNEAAGVRLDRFLAQLCGSRSEVQRWIDEGRVHIGGKQAKAGLRLRGGEAIAVERPQPEALTLEPEPIPLDIVYEDEHLLVVNKPRGLVVHPAPGNRRHTLVNALLAHCPDLPGINGVLRPGIVHRLDKDTTGLLVAAKTELAQRALSWQIRERVMKREYRALVHGVPVVPEGRIEAPIGRDPANRKRMAVNSRAGKLAVTHFRVLTDYGHYALLELRLETGRTHQIRVHLAFIGHPVVGDPVYSRRKEQLGLTGQALHAFRLSFEHPVDGHRLSFETPLPEDFAQALAMAAGQQGETS